LCLITSFVTFSHTDYCIFCLCLTFCFSPSVFCFTTELCRHFQTGNCFANILIAVFAWAKLVQLAMAAGATFHKCIASLTHVF
jgi:hypothetical protein